MKRILKIIFPLILTFVLLFNLTACSDNRFMKSSEYLKGLPASGLIDCTITLRINAKGERWETYDIDYVLDYNAAPITVTNFVYLVQTGFYDYNRFDENSGKDEKDKVKAVMHRLEKTANYFILQGGGYKTNSEKSDDIIELRTGGLDYSIKGEFKNNGWDKASHLSHKTPVLAMARKSGHDTAASEFYMTFLDSSVFDDDYAIFAYLKPNTKINSNLFNLLFNMPVTSERFSFSSNYFSSYPKYKIEIAGIQVDTTKTFPKSLQIPNK